MAGSLNINYELPILDIFAIFIGFVAIIIALIAIYFTNQTRINTSDTVTEIGLNRSELISINIILGTLNQTILNNRNF